MKTMEYNGYDIFKCDKMWKILLKTPRIFHCRQQRGNETKPRDLDEILDDQVTKPFMAIHEKQPFFQKSAKDLAYIVNVNQH